MMTAARRSANALRLAGLMLLAIVTPMVVSEAWAQIVPDDFVITLERSCSAECRIYKVSIDAKGNIEFEGRQIDETAGTSRWIRLDEPTLRQLAKEGWEPSAEERANLLRKAIEDDDAGVVKGLIAIGGDPNGTYFEERSTPLMFVRPAAMVRVLLESGALASTKSVSGITPLNTATLLAPDATEMLLKAGAVPFVEDFDTVIALLTKATSSRTIAK
jgi:hypothetical protein